MDKRSFLCVGLDSDLSRIPHHLRRESSPLFVFNRAIIDATHEMAIAYKLNLAFYEVQGAKGWTALKDTVAYVRSYYPGIFLIADAKRGDTGNTAAMYARAFFREMDFDAVTLSPYMGKDSVLPFLEYEGKWVIILGLTSNPGALDLQMIETKTSRLYEEVIRRFSDLGNPDNMMFVAGATRPEFFSGIRSIVPDHFLLVPGVGAQGGSLEEAARCGMNDQCGIIVNSSRSIIFADSAKSFPEAARREAENLRNRMSILLS